MTAAGAGRLAGSDERSELLAKRNVAGVVALELALYGFRLRDWHFGEFREKGGERIGEGQGIGAVIVRRSATT
jgi:hypothetical protein